MRKNVLVHCWQTQLITFITSPLYLFKRFRLKIRDTFGEQLFNLEKDRLLKFIISL